MGEQQYGNMGLGALQPLSPIKPQFGNAMKQGFNNMLKTPITQVGMAPSPMGSSFNPFAMGASILGNIGGGHRAKLGTEDVWETGGVLQGTDVGNISNALGDVAGNFGPIGSLVGMGLKGVSDIANLIGYRPKVSDIDTGDQFMQEGGPVLQIGDKIGSAGEIKGHAKKMVGQGALAGAKIAGPVGAIIGGLIGKGAKKRAEKAYTKALGEIDETTGEFNLRNIQSSQEEFGQERRLAMLGRERNPFLNNNSNPFIV